MKDKTKTLITDMILGLVFAGIVIAANWKQDYPMSQRLCDGFFVAGVLLMGSGGLRFAKNQGTFDMITYGVSSAFFTAFPSLRSSNPLEQRQEDFFEYRERKRKNAKPCGDLVISGGIYMALAAIAFVIYLMA